MSDNSPNAPRDDQLGALTGLRFVAALAVVIGHLTFDIQGEGRFGLPVSPVALGAPAVSFFFVLSGFILTYVYHGKLNVSNIGPFYFKRGARIWPLHLVCFIVAWAMAQFFVADWRILIANLALLHSWVPDSSWVFSFNGVSWSISTEMFFYLVFPFFLLGGPKRFWWKYFLLWILVIAVVFGLQSASTLPAFKHVEFARMAQANPLLRLPEFCTGMAAGFLFLGAAKNKLRLRRFDTIVEVAALGSIVAYIGLYRWFHVAAWIRTANWGGVVVAWWVHYAGMFAIFAIVIFVFARSQGWLGKLLSSRLFVFLGEISFALYMIHFPVLLFMERANWSATTISPWTLGLGAILISLGVAALLYWCIEMPAKQGLLDLFHGRRMKALKALPIHWSQVFRSPGGLFVTVLLILSIGSLVLIHEPRELSQPIRRVVNQSEPVHRNVKFGNLVSLLGLAAKPHVDGIELEMVWQKRQPSPLHRFRFLHFCDRNGTVISQFNQQSELFDGTSKQPFLDRCLIPIDVLDNESIDQVAIGFFSKETDPATHQTYSMLKINKGPRGMSNYCLFVIEPLRWQELRRSFKNVD